MSDDAVLSADQIALFRRVYDLEKIAGADERDQATDFMAASTIVQLCESHELLRVETDRLVDALAENERLRAQMAKMVRLRPIPMRDEAGAPSGGHFTDGNGNVYALLELTNEP